MGFENIKQHLSWEMLSDSEKIEILKNTIDYLAERVKINEETLIKLLSTFSELKKG